VSGVVCGVLMWIEVSIEVPGVAVHQIDLDRVGAPEVFSGTVHAAGVAHLEGGLLVVHHGFGRLRHV